MDRVACLVGVILSSLAAGSLAADPYGGIDPAWMLLHEPAVVGELKLTARQQDAYRGVMDDLDRRFFPLRNKPSQEATAGLERLIVEANDELDRILRPIQRRRLDEILLRRLGTAAFREDDFAERLHLTTGQGHAIGAVLDEVQEKVAALEKQSTEGQHRERLADEFTKLKTDEQRRILELLTPQQQAAWKDAIGRPFDLGTLGQPALAAPEIVDSGEWINTPEPLALAGLRGKVVVVHFYAANCINCIRNFPTYRLWQERFAAKDVVLIGIHTPETAEERDAAAVRRKAADENLTFPICIDGKNANWSAWGNSMWPSVYVIDKRGYVRHSWPGELKWQGATGDEFLAGRIDALLAE